jgi:hypothetical protein
MQPPRILSAPAFWHALILLWAGLLYWLSSQSSLPSPAKFGGIDKFEHTLYFAAGGAVFSPRSASRRLCAAAKRPPRSF